LARSPRSQRIIPEWWARSHPTARHNALTLVAQQPVADDAQDVRRRVHLVPAQAVEEDRNPGPFTRAGAFEFGLALASELELTDASVVRVLQQLDVPGSLTRDGELLGCLARSV
jgi:hypothetical protein